jgi:hypothetical protein
MALQQHAMSACALLVVKLLLSPTMIVFHLQDG